MQIWGHLSEIANSKLQNFTLDSVITKTLELGSTGPGGWKGSMKFPIDFSPFCWYYFLLPSASEHPNGWTPLAAYVLRPGAFFWRLSGDSAFHATGGGGRRGGLLGGGDANG
jgi:hypothetical protein